MSFLFYAGGCPQCPLCFEALAQVTPNDIPELKRGLQRLVHSAPLFWRSENCPNAGKHWKVKIPLIGATEYDPNSP